MQSSLQEKHNHVGNLDHTRGRLYVLNWHVKLLILHGRYTPAITAVKKKAAKHNKTSQHLFTQHVMSFFLQIYVLLSLW